MDGHHHRHRRKLPAGSFEAAQQRFVAIKRDLSARTGILLTEAVLEAPPPLPPPSAPESPPPLGQSQLQSMLPHLQRQQLPLLNMNMTMAPCTSYSLYDAGGGSEAPFSGGSLGTFAPDGGIGATVAASSAAAGAAAAAAATGETYVECYLRVATAMREGRVR